MFGVTRQACQLVSTYSGKMTQQSCKMAVSCVLARNGSGIAMTNENRTTLSQLPPLECHHVHRYRFHSSPHLRSEDSQMKAEESDSQPLVSSEQSNNAKIDEIVDQISKLNLFEVSQLVTALKAKLNLPDSAMMGGVAMAAAPMQSDAPSGATAEAEEEPTVIEQTIFDVVLKAYPKEAKIQVIKEVRAIFKLGLKEAKALVEKAPCTLEAQCPKVDAEDIKEKLSKLGAEIVLE